MESVCAIPWAMRAGSINAIGGKTALHFPMGWHAGILQAQTKAHGVQDIEEGGNRHILTALQFVQHRPAAMRYFAGCKPN